MDPLGTVTTKLFTATTLARAGVLAPARPDRALRAALALRRFGPSPAAGYTASAARYPDEPAILDDRGVLSFAEVHRRTNALARGLREEGVREGHGVAIMCRNHRGFVEATIACSKLGADSLYLNTAFAGPQIADVVRREDPGTLVYDQEFAGPVAEAGEGRRRLVSWADEGGGGGDPAAEDLIAASGVADLPAPARQGRVVILTSGTTGTPKGAQRHHPPSLDPAAALLDRIPLRAREATHIAAPLFHSWGLAHFTLGMALSSTVVLRRRFDPAGTLAALAGSGATALVAIPVMLQRILELGPEASRHDLSALRVIAASGSALPGDLALRVMDRFGDVLFNLYGSTEVAWATIATPADLRAAPGTAGRPPRGTVVRLLDEEGREVPPGRTGRIFVGNEMTFEGYTGGGDGRHVVGGLMSSGDVGHFDADGRLFVDGRDDDMIVSGGENVFPREVEDLLADHPAVHEVAVIGVEDERFGQRLRAFVVPGPGARPTEDELKEHVGANLARFKVPREVVFLEHLPRNATGKVLKRELAAGGGERVGGGGERAGDASAAGAPEAG